MVLSEFSDADGIRIRRRAVSEAVGRAIQGGCVPIFALLRVTTFGTLCASSRHPIQKKGSSSLSGEGGADFEKEVLVVAEAVGHPLEDFDLVVDSFEEAGVQRPTAMGDDVSKMGFEIASELLQGFDAAADRARVPLFPEPQRMAVKRRRSPAGANPLRLARKLPVRADRTRPGAVPAGCCRPPPNCNYRSKHIEPGRSRARRPIDLSRPSLGQRNLRNRLRPRHDPFPGNSVLRLPGKLA